jgi:cytochrome c oxidase subunit 2
MEPATVGLATLVVGATAIALALWLGRSAPSDDPAAVQAKVYGARRVYLFALAAALIAGSAVTLSADLYATAPGEVVVEVEGQMWSWVFRGAERPLPVGKRVEFRVSAKDVNHGFGVYDEAGRLLVQTQAMPGYTNRVFHTFAAPGRYHVACMEFCGMMHHAMVHTLEVR